MLKADAQEYVKSLCSVAGKKSVFFDNTRYCSCACKVFCHFHYKHIPKEIATQIFKEACVVVKDYSFIVTIEQDPVLSVSGDGNFRAVEKEVINEYLR